MPPLYHRIWQYLKYIVNHQDNTIPMRDGTFLTIKAGQHLTSVRDIAKNVGWYEGVKWKEPNPKTVSTILEWLEKQSMIKIERGKGNRQYTLITLINWDLYQQKDNEGNSKVTDSKHLVDINKNDKECNKNDIYAAANNAHPKEESDGVPTTGQQGDPVPSGEISHTSDAEQMLLNRFIQLRGYGFHSSPNDETAAKEIISNGVPLADALVYLKECFDNYKPKHSRDRINSLSYCVGFILDKHCQKLGAEEGEKHVKKIQQYIRSNGRPTGKSAEQALREAEEARRAWGG
jgi:predicted transcriptional regulator